MHEEATTTTSAATPSSSNKLNMMNNNHNTVTVAIVTTADGLIQQHHLPHSSHLQETMSHHTHHQLQHSHSASSTSSDEISPNGQIGNQMVPQTKIIISSNSLNNNHLSHHIKNPNISNVIVATTSAASSSNSNEYENLSKVPSSSVILNDATIVGGNLSGNGTGNIVIMSGHCDSDDKHSPVNVNNTSSTTTSSTLDQNDSVEIEIHDVAFDDTSGEGKFFF